jgi:hypothetical protein
MADAKTYIYEVFTTTLDNGVGADGGQQAMVQIFRDPDNGKVLHSQLAFRNSYGTWGIPYQLEQK